MLINEEGIPILHTSSRSATNGTKLSKGGGVSSVRIPRFLLSPGVYSVFVNAHTMYEALCSAYNAASFRVIDIGREVLGKSGNMKWPGIISPLLEWKNESVTTEG
jgi:hypothetical protein